MPFRRILFWSHLASGLLAGIFVLIMSVTGIALMYENSIVLALNDNVKVETPTSADPMGVDDLANTAAIRAAGNQGVSLSFDNRANAPVTVKAGRNTPFSVNPYTGEVVDNPAWAAEEFFGTLVGIHRWLGFEGENRKTARAITGVANLAFLFLVISGLYLWLPKIWKWTFIRLNLFFRKSYPTAKARDYNWHQVFSVWALIPLFLIITSGSVFSYPWASQLVYATFGETPPVRGGPPSSQSKVVNETGNVADLITLQQAFETAKTHGNRTWTRITIPLSAANTQSELLIERHFGDRIIPRQRETLNIDRTSGEITKVATIQDLSPGQRARTFIRFLHTGETFGLIGATIAGLASLAACFLVWTGFALSWRRLIRPLLRKKAA